MTNYRCYFMDRDNRVDAASVIRALSDRDALGFAISQLMISTRCVALELWDGARCVAKKPRLEFA